MISLKIRIRSRSPLTLLVAVLLLASTQLNAQGVEPITESITDSVVGAFADSGQLAQITEEPIEIPNLDTPQSRWEDFLTENNYHEGLNTMDGKTFFLQSASVRVRGSFGPRWIAARNAAFESAELATKAKLAEAIGTEITAKRSFATSLQGPDSSPRVRETMDLQRQLSLVEKGERLMSAELDARLRRHYPDWDGTGVSPEQRQMKVATASTALTNEMKSGARQLISGASIVFQNEGYDDRGNYVVLVGIVWSRHMHLVARSLKDPEIQIPDARPGQPIREVLAMQLAEDPNYLAKFDGIRIWRDENGQRVVVSVASHDRGSEDFITEQKNQLLARTRIARFAAELISSGADTPRSNSNTDTPNHRTMREYADGSFEVFDTDRFVSEIEGIVEKTRITGTQVIKNWRGVHPMSGSPMITTVMMWKPDSAKQINQFSREISAPTSHNHQDIDRPVGTTHRTLTGPAAEFDDF